MQDVPQPEMVQAAERPISADNFEVRSGGIRMEINLDMPEVVNRVVEVPEEPQPRQVAFENDNYLVSSWRQNQDLAEAMPSRMEQQ